jgi:hypothetical protein
MRTLQIYNLRKTSQQRQVFLSKPFFAIVTLSRSLSGFTVIVFSRNTPEAVSVSCKT